MGFCRRCGDITTADRCKCGGTSRDSTTKKLLPPSANGGDRWSSRYLSRTSTGGPSVSATPRRSTSPTKPDSVLGSPSRTLLPPLSRPASPSKLHASFLRQNEDEGELGGVFGSVLSPKDQWKCGACDVKFKQEEVIYPHPDAKSNPKLAELFFCRQCFAERFRKGNWRVPFASKNCRRAVLSDAPFVKHDSNLWHTECFVCSYCANPTTPAIIDFASRPSCEDCFDREAYKSHGIAPSPHLSQSEFLKAPVNVPPAPSKWGRQSTGPPPPRLQTQLPAKGKENVWSSMAALSPSDSKLVGLGVAPSSSGGGGGESAEKPKAWRIKQERDKSPLVPSLNELGEKLRKAGFEDVPKPRSPVKASTSSFAVVPHPPSPIALPGMTTQRRPLPNPPVPTSPTKTTPRSLSPIKSPSLAERAAPFLQASQQPPTPSSSSRGHGRSMSVPVNKLSSPFFTSSQPSEPPAKQPPPSSTARPVLAPLQASTTGGSGLSRRPLPSPLQKPSSPTKPSFPTPTRPTFSSTASAFPTISAVASAKDQLTEKHGTVSLDDDEDHCSICHKELGYEGEFVELSSGKVLHRGCFTCGGCDEKLESGRYVETEGKWWHQSCAPAPQRYRCIITSPADSPPPSSPAPSPPLTLPLSGSDPACKACALPLGYGPSVTVPTSGRSFHQECFRCAKCEGGFVWARGEKGFVEVGGKAYHDKCAPPPASPSPSIRSSPFFALDSASASSRPSLSSASSLSRHRSVPVLPSSLSLAASSTSSTSSTVLSSALTSLPSQRSIFSRLPAPPTNLGGLLICAGCSTRATSRETIAGPLGRRFHARCLVCRGCGRGLDSECRVGEGGELRCEGCRRVEGKGMGVRKAVAYPVPPPSPRRF